MRGAAATLPVETEATEPLDEAEARIEEDKAFNETQAEADAGD